MISSVSGNLIANFRIIFCIVLADRYYRRNIVLRTNSTLFPQSPLNKKLIWHGLYVLEW